MVVVGDMVMIYGGRGKLYSGEGEVEWKMGECGVVVGVEELEGYEYKQVTVLLGERVGWTYSDYLEVL